MAAPINRLESLWPQSEAAEMAARREAASWSKQAKTWEENLESVLRKHPNVVIELGELQVQLFGHDVKSTAKKTRTSLVLGVVAACVLLGAVPVLLMAI